MNKTLGIIGILFALIVGYGGGFWHGSINANKELKDILYADMEEPKNELLDFSGIVKEVSAGELVVNGPVSPSPLIKWPSERKVLIGSQTKTVIIKSRTQAELDLELEKFRKNMETADPNNPPLEPTLTWEEEISLSDIKPGNNVIVFSNKNVAEAEKFEASKIVLVPALEPTIIGENNMDQ